MKIILLLLYLFYTVYFYIGNTFVSVTNVYIIVHVINNPLFKILLINISYIISNIINTEIIYFYQIFYLYFNTYIKYRGLAETRAFLNPNRV